MKPVLTILLALVAASNVTLSAQTKPSVKEGVRPVFLTASTLAGSCQDWAAVFYPYGHAIRDEETVNVSEEQVRHAISCQSYILGAADQEMEPAFDSHYRPLASTFDKKLLIETFLKYLKEHPDKSELAATTLLSEAKQIAAKSEKR